MTAPTFPLVPRDLTVELYALGDWQDIFPDVQVAEKTDVVITRGRPNESGDPPPQTCTLRLDNRTGKYSTRNPMSPYYGPTGLGRNTPLRVAVRSAKDSFARTASNGWGTADVGGAWSWQGNSAAEFAVSGGVATQSVAAANSYRLTYLTGQLYYDVEVAATVTLPFGNVTGGNVEPATLVLGGLSTSDYFLATVKITAAEAITIGITHFDGTVVVADTATGITFTGQALRVKFQRDAQNLRAKVWADGSPEPYAWTVDGRSDRLFRRAPGWNGVRSGVAAGNTNAAPVVFSYSNFEVRVPRFAGEVSKWPPKWDVSGKNGWTTITASGIRRRLGQGQTPLKTPYLRGNQTIQPPHLAYYPVQDLSDSKQVASGIGGSPLLISGPGTPQFASDSSFPGSSAIGKPNQSRWIGPTLTGVPATGQAQLMFLLSVPTTGETDQATFAQIQLTGTLGFVDVFYQTGSGGRMKLNFYDQGRNLITTFGPTGQLDGQPQLVSLDLAQSGADITYVLGWWTVGAPTAFVTGSTLTGRTVGAPNRVLVAPYTQVASSAIGHVALRNNTVSIFALGAQLTAYAGETASNRIFRLCGDNGIPIQHTFNPQINSAALGVQAQANVTDLIDEAAEADLGSVYESRSVLGLWRRGRSSLYNQPAVLALDYATAGHVAPPFAPVEDDQFTRNDVTVTRKNGSSYEVIQTTGPMAVTNPSDGAGVGRYDDAVTLNLATDTQTPDAAAWLVHLGTVDETRYPQLTVDLNALTRVDPARALAALAVNLDDRITVSSPKLEVSPDTLSLLARGYTERIGQFKHQITFNCAPETPYQALQFDTAGSKWDSADSVLAAAATSTATSLVVASPSGQQWTTNPAAMPIALRVGGEVVSATAVANENLSNTNLESGLAPWTPTGTAPGTGFTQSGTQKHGGSFAARLVPTGAASAVNMSSELVPVVAGMPVTVSGWVWCTNAVTNNFGLAINWFDAASGYLSTSITTGSVPAATWTQFTSTYTAPAGAAQATLVPALLGTPAAGQIFYLDDLSFTGPQRFTVTRSVNRVVKAQASGTAIALARRATLGL